MMACPICRTEYDPHFGDCPSCGPIPHKPGASPGVLVPDYSQPGVRERVAAEADYCEGPNYRRNK